MSPVLNKEITSQLALTFIASNFELIPVYRQLFKSEHFFDLKSSNVLIKSPIDLMLGLHKTLGFKLDDTLDLEVQFRNKCRDMGQIIFSPVDVAGWQENHDWISTGTLPMRWGFIEYILNRHWAGNKEQFRTFIISIVGMSSCP